MGSSLSALLAKANSELDALESNVKSTRSMASSAHLGPVVLKDSNPPVPSLILESADLRLDMGVHIKIHLAIHTGPEAETGAVVYIARRAPMRVLRFHAAYLGKTVPYGVMLMHDGQQAEDVATPETLGLETGALVDAWLDPATASWVRTALYTRKKKWTVGLVLWRADVDAVPRTTDGHNVQLKMKGTTPLANLKAVFLKWLQTRAGLACDGMRFALEHEGMYLPGQWPLVLFETETFVASAVAEGKNRKGSPPKVGLLLSMAEHPRTVPQTGLSASFGASMVSGSGARASTSTSTSTGAAPAEASGDTVVAQFRLKNEVVKLRFSRSDGMGKVLEKARERLGLGEAARFIFDGDVVGDGDTAEDLDLDDMDLIDALP